jgi:hypothetical protein
VSWLPGLVIAALLVLILSQLLYAFAPYRHRDYRMILALTGLGVALGQLWDYVGLPALRLGEANVLPALVFALGFQPLADRLPRPWAR